MEIEHSIVIAAPAAAVWAILMDVEQWPEWTDSVTSADRDRADQPLEVGSRVTIRQPRIGRLVWTVTEIAAGVSFTWRASSPGVVTTATHGITGPPAGPVTVRLALTQTGPLSPIVEAVTGKRTRSYLTTEASGLRARAEQQWQSSE
jgi:uncharacterized protein YndB with AHSA1/START domain